MRAKAIDAMVRVAAALAAAALPSAASAERLRCPPDAVPVGPVCVDRYEASVWQVPSDATRLVDRIRSGRADVDHLVKGGAMQLGTIGESCIGVDYGAGFPRNGNWTTPVYAVSVPGVLPSTCITWFQAEQACRLSGKRLLTNAEWQAAAAGTPDPGAFDDQTTTCVTSSAFASPTGSRVLCVSSWGAYDMAGNVWEWVADWVSPATSCTFWAAEYGSDLSCIATGGAGGAGVPVSRELVAFDPDLPGAMIRGGNFATGDRNGIFAIHAGPNASNVSRSTGFRCAR